MPLRTNQVPLAGRKTATSVVPLPSKSAGGGADSGTGPVVVVVGSTVVVVPPPPPVETSMLQPQSSLGRTVSPSASVAGQSSME